MEKFDTFRDHFLSLYQSAVDDIARKLDEKTDLMPRSTLQRSATSTLPSIAADICEQDFALHHGQSTSPGIRTRELTKGGIGWVCADLAFRYLKARLAGDSDAIARLNDEFLAGTCDPAWRSTIEEYLKFFGPNGTRNEIPYIRAGTVGASLIEIESDARIAIMGDWGTGAQPALELLKQVSDDEPNILIHVGDIYYSGTPAECQKNFSEPVQRILRTNNRNPKVFTLSGNHDMYCGGLGYYELIKHLNPAPYTQPASFFGLRTKNERWQFLAMDTGLHDYSPMGVADVVTYLEPDELEWHCKRIDEFPGRTILLSHHQLFSAFSAIGPAKNDKRSAMNPKLYEAFKKMAQSQKIAAWFWGHEHTLSIYEPFGGLERGRCVGHGAVPTSIVDKIYDPLPNLDITPAIKNGTQLAQVGGVYAHGYAILNLEQSACKASYFQDTGGKRNLIFEELIN